mmetsp:Transcript_15563/g.42402  ORF Transcript_15563/g.42402 Transcript_15563/m.42402 type:complete len:210 (-) Transcript_15563:1301-1930(-)
MPSMEVPAWWLPSGTAFENKIAPWCSSRGQGANLPVVSKLWSPTLDIGVPGSMSWRAVTMPPTLALMGTELPSLSLPVPTVSPCLMMSPTCTLYSSKATPSCSTTAAFMVLGPVASAGYGSTVMKFASFTVMMGSPVCRSWRAFTTPYAFDFRLCSFWWWSFTVAKTSPSAIVSPTSFSYFTKWLWGSISPWPGPPLTQPTVSVGSGAK